MATAQLARRLFATLYIAQLASAAIWAAASPAPGPAAPPTEKLPAVVEFNRCIRPIMANSCFKCHGPDVKNNKSDLRLDSFDTATARRQDKTGRVTTAIVPGNPDASEVWRRLNASDATVRMPPPDFIHQLSPGDKAMIQKWIAQGARYEPHWAYVPPVKRPAPAVRDPSAVRNPIDAFIVAALDERGIALSPEADRRTLIRRVSLDLTGLPPTVAETEAFASSASADAYEQLIDRLLASPRYGERMATPWLDLVRFADTVGFHGDQRQNIFPYRDYVIAAFNHNKPFDQFTVEQIAGDLLPNATDEQRVATGFNRLNAMTREGGAQAKEYLAKYAADRVRAVGTAWLGSTIGCAECHDHKYDPFKTRDFYSLEAYFADVTQWGVYSSYGYTPETDLAGFNNDYPFPPEIEIESDYLKRRANRLRDAWHANLAAATRAIVAGADESVAARTWAGQVVPRLEADPAGWATAPAENVQPGPIAKAEILPDGAVRLSANTDQSKKADDAPAGETPAERAKREKARNLHTITLRAPAGPVAAVRLEALPDASQGGSVSRATLPVTRAKFPVFEIVLTLALQRAGEDAPQSLPIADAHAEQETETYENGYVAVSVRQHWRSSRRLGGERQSAVFYLSGPVELREGDRLVATVASGDVNLVRFSVSPLGVRPPGERDPAETLASLRASPPSPAQAALLATEYFLGTGRPDAAGFAAAQKHARDIADCRDGRAFTMVTVATQLRTTRVLPRGNWQDDSGEVVDPAPPAFLTKTGLSPEGSTTRQTRLDLARWIASRDNPLTARAFVNRLWKQFFGIGLSAVVDDLGMQGEYPSHPELLDWLATEFVDRGWDVKAMVRLIVTSATYRQSSRYRPELTDIDPQNRLLARQSARRLEAEFVRDNALAVAGLLDAEIGGPSGLPYQPEGYYAQLNFPLRDYVADTDDRQYRRGVYVHWQRTFLHPMLANFDAPGREECTASRNISTSPQQALTLLNDPTFVEAARAFAERVLAEKPAGGFASRLDGAFRLLLARPPEPREAASLQTFYEARLAEFREKPDDAAKFTAIGLRGSPASIDRVELAAWTSVARVLLNLNEAIVRY